MQPSCNTLPDTLPVIGDKVSGQHRRERQVRLQKKKWGVSTLPNLGWLQSYAHVPVYASVAADESSNGQVMPPLNGTYYMTLG